MLPVLGALGFAAFLPARRRIPLASIHSPGLVLQAGKAEFDGHKFTGLVYEFYPNHRLYRLFWFWRGQEVGTERHWYMDGSLWVEREYRDGLPEGEWRQWYQNGRVKFLNHYVHGEPDGEFWGWHPNGQLSDYDRFSHGRLLAHKSWIPDGRPFQNYRLDGQKKIGLYGGEFCKARSKPAG